jgi:hypothetical protein
MIAYELDLNLRPGGVLPRLNVSQYDKGQTVTCVLWDGNTAFVSPIGSAAYVVGTKPDGTGFEYACEYENGQPVFTITEQMSAIAGEVTCELRIITTDEQQGTINFVLDVEKSALSSDAPISETDLPIIQQLPEIVAECDAASQLAHQWATYGASGETPSATNNAYYWAMQAASYAGGGLHPEVVQSLPTTNISTTTLYFVPSSDPSQSNFYDEYINIDGTTAGWELIGTTAVDLSDYYTKTEVDTAVSGVQDQVDAITVDAKEYDPTKNYVVGDTCYYNGLLYEFIGAHTGAWDDLYVDCISAPIMNHKINSISTHLSEKIGFESVKTIVPSTDNTNAYFSYPSGYSQTTFIVLAIEAFNGTKLTVNPTWAQADLYYTNGAVLCGTIPSEYKGKDLYIQYALVEE